MCRKFLGRSARFEIAIAVRKSNHPISIRNVQKMWIVARWIKSDSERFVQIVFCKSLRHIRLSVGVGIAQHFYLIGTTLYNEDVAIRRGEQKARVAKSAGIQFDFETRRNVGLCVGWSVYDVRPIN